MHVGATGSEGASGWGAGSDQAEAVAQDCWWSASEPSSYGPHSKRTANG
jgi:hypothetical protein